MNEYALLYYPDFHPDSVWLRRVLLLSDTVTRIVPSDVELNDPHELHGLQESIPGCLRTIAPEERDVTIESQNLPRLAKAFSLLAHSQRKRSGKKIVMTLSSGSMSISGHVFLHSAKISPVIREQLHRHRLILDGFGEGGFLAVDEAASHLILSAIAENISRRTGFDTITDKPIPFALNALNSLGVGEVCPADAEGSLLSSLACVLIPAGVGSLEQSKYRLLRESYASIRGGDVSTKLHDPSTFRVGSCAFYPTRRACRCLVEDDHATIESVNPVSEDENLAADLRQALAEVNHARTRNRKVA